MTIESRLRYTHALTKVTAITSFQFDAIFERIPSVDLISLGKNTAQVFR